MINNNEFNLGGMIMSKLSVIQIHPENYNYQNFCLNFKTNEVKEDEFNKEELNSIIKNMFDTLYSYPSGVGLAANQVGILKRICVIDTKRDGKKPLVCINPNYEPISNEKDSSTEQCLSFPLVSVTIQRYKKVKVTYQDIYGNKNELIADGFKSIVFQHEIDHLNGITFIDNKESIEKCECYSTRLSKKAMEALENE